MCSSYTMHGTCDGTHILQTLGQWYQPIASGIQRIVRFWRTFLWHAEFRRGSLDLYYKNSHNSEFSSFSFSKKDFLLSEITVYNQRRDVSLAKKENINLVPMIPENRILALTYGFGFPRSDRQLVILQ